jgi:DNA polymerase III alpha subunit
MKLDEYSQSIFDSDDLFDIIYEQGLESIHKIIVENNKEIQKFNENNNDIILTTDKLQIFNSVELFDEHNQKSWLMPEEYQNFDIEGFLVHVCPKQNYQRLIEELQEFRNRNMLNLLRWLKYFVDICRKNNIVWGVGRGSSVASYVLYLLGVHKIDSIKYKLDWKEFLR